MVETTRDGDFFTLGEYKNRDTCLKVLSEILDSYRAMLSYHDMPLGGDV